MDFKDRKNQEFFLGILQGKIVLNIMDKYKL